LGLDFDTETQGEKLAVTTKRHRWGMDLDPLLRGQMSIKGRYMLEGFNDPNSIAGEDKIHHLFDLEFL
jgi:hypothetical protein